MRLDDLDNEVWRLIKHDGRSPEEAAALLKRPLAWVKRRFEILQRRRTIATTLILPGWFTPEQRRCAAQLWLQDPHFAQRYVQMQIHWEFCPPRKNAVTRRCG
jgi:hypothetical protein